MISIRRKLMAKVQSEPEEYLDFDGTFYFKTGYVPTADTQVIVQFSCNNDISSNMAIFGSREDTYINSFYAWARVDDAGKLRIERSQALDSVRWTNVFYLLESQNVYVIDTDASTLSKNGLVVANWSYEGTPFLGNSYQLFIGQINNHGRLMPGLKFTGKMYHFEIVESGVTARDYVPYNGTLKDRITGQVLEKYYS